MNDPTSNDEIIVQGALEAVNFQCSAAVPWKHKPCQALMRPAFEVGREAANTDRLDRKHRREPVGGRTSPVASPSLYLVSEASVGRLEGRSFRGLGSNRRPGLTDRSFKNNNLN